MASCSSYHSEGSGCTSTTADCNIQEANSKAFLGLEMVKTQPLLSLLAGACERLSRGNNINNVVSQNHPISDEKLKASNFPITTISVGDWKRVSRKEGELTAKLYFKKRKLVWEFLDGQLKSKMEVAWSDIIALNAIMLPNQNGILQIELGNPPSFFRELTPQPRKHTNWQQASDFTHGQAPLYRRHYATFPPGALDNHYEKLLQHDQNLYELSKRPFPSQESPFFNTALPLQINIVNTVGFEQQQQQQESRFDHQSQVLHHLQPTLRNSDVWANQTTFLDSSLIDRQKPELLQVSPLHVGYDNNWEYCEYPPPPPQPQPPLPVYENVNIIDPIIPARNNVNSIVQQSGGYDYGYGYGYGGLSAADEEEVMKINGDERYKWLIPHILGTANSNHNHINGDDGGISQSPIDLYPTLTTNVQHLPYF